MHPSAPATQNPALALSVLSPVDESPATGLRAERKRRRRAKRRGLGFFRLALAALEVIALWGNFNYVLGFSSFATANFFSYFTIQTAMITVVVLVVAGLIALLRKVDPPWLAIVRTTVMCYLLVSGIVFAMIVAQASTRSYRVDVPWSDTLLHFVVPALALVAWLYDAYLSPRTSPMPWSTLGWVLPFPVVWLVFTLIRGAEVGWYPYFFLDPVLVGGPIGIAFYCLIVLIIFLGVTALLVAISRFVTARASASRRRRAAGLRARER